MGKQKKVIQADFGIFMHISANPGIFRHVQNPIKHPQCSSLQNC